MKITSLLLLGVLLTFIPSTGAALETSVEFQLEKTLDLAAPGRDIAIASDGRIYQLGADGRVRVIASDGSELGRIEVGREAGRIFLGQNDQRLYVSDRQGRTIKTIALTEVFTIPLDGSPFKGPADAAVAMVVFSDFQ